MVLIRNRLHAFIFFFSFLCALHSFIKTAFVFVLFLCRFYCGYAFATKINRLLVKVNICFIQIEVKRDNKMIRYKYQNPMPLWISTQNSFSIFFHVWYPPCNWIADSYWWNVSICYTEYSDTSTESTYIYEIDTVAFIYWSYRAICDMCGYICVVAS